MCCVGICTDLFSVFHSSIKCVAYWSGGGHLSVFNPLCNEPALICGQYSINQSNVLCTVPVLVGGQWFNPSIKCVAYLYWSVVSIQSINQKCHVTAPVLVFLLPVCSAMLIITGNIIHVPALWWKIWPCCPCGAGTGTTSILWRRTTRPWIATTTLRFVFQRPFSSEG